MKKVTAIGLVLLLSLQCFYQLGVITYFQINREYIAEVLCVNKQKPMMNCHGQCFLERNLNLTDNSSEDKAAVPTQIQTTEFPIFLISKLTFGFDLRRTLQESQSYYLVNSSCKHALETFRPPAFLS